MNKTAIISFVLINLLSFTYANVALSWNEETHMLLSEYAADFSNLLKCQNLTEANCDSIKKIGLSEGLKEALIWNEAKREAKEWIAQGANFEDEGSNSQGIAGTARYVNHFHNPLKPWTTAGLDDWVVFHYTGESSLIWAQDSTKQSNWLGGDWSWIKVREHYYIALTGKDFTDKIVAPNKEKRDAHFAQMFRGLGHQMHLIQDAGQPAHVRNDAHIRTESSQLAKYTIEVKS